MVGRRKVTIPISLLPLEKVFLTFFSLYLDEVGRFHFFFFLKFSKCGELDFPEMAKAIFPGPAFCPLLFSHQEEESTSLPFETWQTFGTA